VSYLTQNDIANNSAMMNRVAQAATQEAIAADNDRWTYENRRAWASAPGWDAAWDSALASHPDDPDYDPGTDEAVITDGMILSQVQSMTPTPPGGARGA
jgi:hypothetical protein